MFRGRISSMPWIGGLPRPVAHRGDLQGFHSKEVFISEFGESGGDELFGYERIRYICPDASDPLSTTVG